jgi:hypothetical protein
MCPGPPHRCAAALPGSQEAGPSHKRKRAPGDEGDEPEESDEGDEQEE